MLIMHLRVDESIELQDGVEILVSSMGVRGMRLRGGWVKLAITAPKHVRVRRARTLGTRPARKP